MPTHDKFRGARRELAVLADDVVLDGFLDIPAGASGLVLFAHGSGSSRHSTRNHYVASVLNQARIGTLLFDLLTSEEGEIDAIDRHLRFDIDLLARRVMGAIDWCEQYDETRDLPIGLFGASTGAAAALVAAAKRAHRVVAVVSRGGRPDLAEDALPRVKAETLLIVGSRDREVLAMNQSAARQMKAPVQMAVIEGATHLFEEPGTLEQAATQAASFFRQRFATAGA